MLISQICKQADFETAWFKLAYNHLRIDDSNKYHRKYWEWCYIYQALLERNMLTPGQKGLGFGIGKEPLVAAFAAKECVITATDQDIETAQRTGWTASNEHSSDINDLNDKAICNPEQFRKLVFYENVDMNHIPEKYKNYFDFTWSSCCFEHLGSIKLGQKFIIQQMNCLRPGGLAIHTTEFNLSSNTDTISTGPTVLFRKKDIELLVDAIRNEDHSIDIDYTIGNGEIEKHVDIPPYHPNSRHLRLFINQFASTSIGIIIKKKM